MHQPRIADAANRFGNDVSNFFLSVFAGRHLHDTQCGLRRYPVLSEGGWFMVVKCPACLASLSREPWNRLGWIVLEKGDAKTALTYLSPASHTLPDDPVVQYHLAAALKETGKSDEARAMLEKLLQSDVAFDGRDGAKQLLSELTPGLLVPLGMDIVPRVSPDVLARAYEFTLAFWHAYPLRRCAGCSIEWADHPPLPAKRC